MMLWVMRDTEGTTMTPLGLLETLT
jgi:hypothetical protein